WLVADDATSVSLCVDGQERLQQTPDLPRPDAVSLGWSNAKGFRFHLGSCRLDPGQHAIQVIPSVYGIPQAALPGDGIPATEFDVDIPLPNFQDPGLFEYLLQEHSTRPEIRRLLIADARVNYRPEQWRGDVIFVDGLPDSPSSRYRVKNIQDELV